MATAYAASLGTMKVTEQIDAITMLGNRSGGVPGGAKGVGHAGDVTGAMPAVLWHWHVVGHAQQFDAYRIPPVFWSSMRT